MSTDLVPGLAALVARYDAFILDLWGTLHDGEALYPWTVGTLAALTEAGRPVCLLSNAPRTPEVVRERLDRMGLPRTLYGAIVTSGGATRAALAARADSDHAALGPAFHHLGPPRDRSCFEGLPFYREAPVASADWVLNTGPDRVEETLDDHLPVMRAALDRDVTMLCANPDVTVVVGARSMLCAGALARWYAGQGGRVIWHGKPHAGVFATALAALGGPDPRRVLVVGDGPETDVLGAKRAALDSALVAGGILRDRALTPDGAVILSAALAACAEAGAHPTWVLPACRWA